MTLLGMRAMGRFTVPERGIETMTTLTRAARACVVAIIVTAAGHAHADDRTPATFELPKEITPALRAACEGDVRRLCIVPSSTIASVKSCIAQKYFQLGATCRREITSAGLSLAMLR
jgi:hypothetical protein